MGACNLPPGVLVQPQPGAAEVHGCAQALFTIGQIWQLINSITYHILRKHLRLASCHTHHLQDTMSELILRRGFILAQNYVLDRVGQISLAGSYGPSNDSGRHVCTPFTSMSDLEIPTPIACSEECG